MFASAARQRLLSLSKKNDFNKVLVELKSNSLFAHTRKLNPQSKKTITTTLYSENIVEEIKKQYSTMGK